MAPGPRDDLPPLRGPAHRLVVREGEPGGTGDALARRVAVLDARQRTARAGVPRGVVRHEPYRTGGRSPPAAGGTDSAGEFDVAYVDGAAEQQDLTERRAAVGGHPMVWATEVGGRAMEGAGATG
ncbi:hypothetical protein ACFRDV_18835 [Streptomyces fagopyri]|uniref:hypothetical protein n=1 Tax=Streptomyces fagopyri TaxID=2662397 RepID=UPI0036994E0C